MLRYQLFKNPQSLTVSIIIPNWNGKHLLDDCLLSLNRQTQKNMEIIVIDNGSSDGSVEFIEANYPMVRLIKLQKNIGFSPAVNKGMAESKGKYIVLINNDTKSDNRAVEYLVKAAETHPEVGMVAAKMMQFFAPDTVDSAGDYIDAVGHANNIGYGQKDSEEFRKSGYVFLVTGGGCLLKRQMLEEIGFFDDDFFAYFEDVDLSLRAQLQGYKAWYEARSVIYHIHKATSSKNKPFTEYLQFRNMTINVLKNFPGYLLLNDFNWLKIILVNVNTIKYLAINGYLKSALRAEWYVLVHILEIINKRQEIQRKITVSKEYIISNVVPKKITFFGLLKKGI